MNLLNEILPWWARWLALTLSLLLVFTFGQLRGERIAGEKHIAYVEKQTGQTVGIAKAQRAVVAQTQVKAGANLERIYLKGAEREKQVPIYITEFDNSNFRVNVGFVRLYNAAWSGDDPGPTADSDREPAAISLAEISQTEAANATSCLAWRELALGLREYYAHLQAATNAIKQF